MIAQSWQTVCNQTSFSNNYWNTVIFSSEVESLTPQLINAGRIRMVYPDNKSADEHFENLRKQYAENLQRLRGLCDVATDSKAFVAQSFIAMEKHSGKPLFIEICTVSLSSKDWDSSLLVTYLVNFDHFWSELHTYGWLGLKQKFAWAPKQHKMLS